MAKCSAGHELQLRVSQSEKNPGRQFYSGEKGSCNAFKWVGDKYVPKCKPDATTSPKVTSPAKAFKIQKPSDQGGLDQPDKFICLAPKSLADFGDSIFTQFMEVDLFTKDKTDSEIAEQFLQLLTYCLNEHGIPMAVGTLKSK